MSDLIHETILQLLRRRKGLIYRKLNDPGFAGSWAAFEIAWNELILEKYLTRIGISEITDDLQNRRIAFKK
jgi:hypothetical protein